MAESIAERIGRWTDKSAGPDGCWPWLGWGTRPNGKAAGGTPHIAEYLGSRKDGYRSLSVRRWMWEHINGPLPDGVVVSTSCRANDCVNPRHAVVRTFSEQSRLVAPPIGRCRSGRHDLTDPANLRPEANGKRQGCLPCLREKQRAYSAAEVADGRCAARKRKHRTS